MLMNKDVALVLSPTLADDGRWGGGPELSLAELPAERLDHPTAFTST